MNKIVLTASLVLTFGSPGVGQEEVLLSDAEGSGLDQHEVFGSYSPQWGYEWTAASRALNPDGTASDSLAPYARDWIEREIADFERLFGSATEHGLRHGTVPPERFYPLDANVSWGFRLADHLGSVLLLSEVAVKATIKSVAFGLGTGGSPKALLGLSDVEPLTGRSPMPEYAVVSLGRLVIGEHVFCGERGPIATGDPETAYPPRVGSQVVLIGAWHNGAVLFGEPHDSWYGELRNGEVRWSYGGYDVESLAAIRSRITELERRGLFEKTAHLVVPEDDRMGRSLFARQWADLVAAGCWPTSVSADEDGLHLPACEVEQ